MHKYLTSALGQKLAVYFLPLESLLRLFNLLDWICVFNLSWRWTTLVGSKRVGKGLSLCDLRRNSSYNYDESQKPQFYNLKLRWQPK